MSVFLRLLDEKDKAVGLKDICARQRAKSDDPRVFEIESAKFKSVPGKPFAYWVSEAVRSSFEELKPLETAGRKVLGGLKTLDDERFLRCWWEIDLDKGWVPIAKGGAYSPFYSDLPLVVNWRHQGEDISWYGYQRRPREGFGASSRGVSLYGRPGITWGRRTQVFGPRFLPSGCIFSDKGPAVFCCEGDALDTKAVCAVMLSSGFLTLVGTRLNAADATARSFEVGVIKDTPVPDLSPTLKTKLASLAHRAWSLKRTLDTVEETSHAFSLPAALSARLGDYDPSAVEAELVRIQAQIDSITSDLYGFSDADPSTSQTNQVLLNEDDVGSGATEVPYSSDRAVSIDQMTSLLNWAIGVAFGRFDWRIATGERRICAESEPFDPLPAKSPGMLPEGETPFHIHSGILVDDPGHPHDLVRLVEEVLGCVDLPLPDDVRRWLRRDFFPSHLKSYSKSRRKAPIYWPLSTISGSYTLWVYYPSLTSQTLFTAINDFVEPKLKQVGAELTALRHKGPARSYDDERQFENLQAFELELIELRDTMLMLAPTYKPHDDDGVQISAAPLWPLFRHKSWQKVLKDTWNRLEKGDHDWARLALNYWPDRVKAKCKTDKSLAIGHDFSELFVGVQQSDGGSE